MKLLKIINPRHLNMSPKHLFRSKKDRSMVSRSDPSSFSSGTASSSSSDTSVYSNNKGSAGGAAADVGTPTSVLPQASGDWSDISCDTYCELVQAFRLIDRDNDGIISRSELETLLTHLGTDPPSQEEVANMLMEVDIDGDGCISVQALASRIGPACDPPAGDELRVAFEFFDTDQDGKIAAEELLRVFRAIGDEGCTLEDCSRMIAEVDKNGDGFVCFEDFSRLMALQR